VPCTNVLRCKNVYTKVDASLVVKDGWKVGGGGGEGAEFEK